MTIQEFKSLKVGDLVSAFINVGITGISTYQYIGEFTDHAYNERKHVFISPHFVSTICLLADNLERSRHLKTIFLTEKEAIKCKEQATKEDRQF
jgi:hypothetical protein